MTNKIKISKTQWLASGVKSGYLDPQDDGTFILNKKAINLAQGWNTVKSFAKMRPYLSSFIGGTAVGGITSLLQNTTILNRAKDWWKGGNETPEMLKSLTNARDAYDKQIKQLINKDSSPVSLRLQQALNSWRGRLDDTIQKVTQSLTERGMGPAQEAGQRLLQNERDMEDMRRAAQMPPHNQSDISHLMQGAASAPSGQQQQQQQQQSGASAGASSAASASSGGSAAKPDQSKPGINPAVRRVLDTAPQN